MNGVKSFTTGQGNVQETNTGGHLQSAGTFAFRKRWCQIDWRSLVSVDIDRVVREMDFQTLQQNIFNVAFCNIDAEEFRSLDPNFVKLFKLGQLIIEYLMHSQQYLQEQMSSQEQQIQHVTEELQLSRNEVKARVEEVKKVKRENRKRKKVIEAYQEMMNAGATGLHTCVVCHKEFVSAEFMRSHMQRRHPDHLSTENKANMEQAQTHVAMELQKSLLEQMNNRLRETEEHIKQEIANRVSIREQRVVEENVHEMEQWKKKETEQLEQEVKRSVEPLMAEINKIQQEKATMEQELKKQEALILALQAHNQAGQAAPIDAESSSRTRKRSKREEEDKTGEIKQLLETQMNMMQQQLKKQEKQWKKRMQEVTTNHQQQLAESSQKISSLEESLHHTEQSSLDPTILNTIQELQQRVHRQEEQISKQQQQRNAMYQQQLRSASASPVSQPTTPVKASSTAMYQHHNSDTGSDSEGAGNMLTVSSLTATLPATVSKQQHVVQFVQPDQDNDTDEEDGAIATAGEDEIDTAVAEHTPFEQRPMIKTRFAHNQKMLENMQHETAVILEQAFAQRGISKDTTGLTDTALEEKLRNLALERQKRIQSHVEFVEHRERIVKELDQMIGVSYKPANQQTTTAARNDKFGGQGQSSLTPVVNSGSTPNTPTKKHSKPPLVSKAPVVTSTPQPVSHSVVTAVKATPATRIDDDSSSLTESTNSISEGAPASTAAPPQASNVAPPTPIKVTQITSEQGDSPWDSDSDGSNDVIGTTSKTKATHTAHHQTATVTTVKPFDISSDSEETFSLTEISEIPTGEKVKHATGPKAAVTKSGSKGTVSSQSALTTVTAMDYDDMSDLDSDLEITQLT